MFRRMLMLGFAAYFLTAADVAQSLGRKKKESEEVKVKLLENAQSFQVALMQGKAIIFFVESAEEQHWATADGKREFKISYLDYAKSPQASGMKKLNYIYNTYFVDVDPGTYYVRQISQDLHKTRHVEVSTGKADMKDAIGRISFNNTQFSEWYTSTQSYGELGHQEQVIVGQTCGGGVCGAIYEDRYIVDRPAGQATSRHEAIEDGVILSVDYLPEHSPASITVQPGDVVFADSLHFTKNDSFGWDAAKCGAVTGTDLECPLTGYRVVRTDAQKSLKSLQAELKKQFWSDEMLQMIQYRRLEMNGRSAGIVRDDEEIYVSP